MTRISSILQSLASLAVVISTASAVLLPPDQNAGALAGQSTSTQRKSIAFGPSHSPHRHFVTNEYKKAATFADAAPLSKSDLHAKALQVAVKVVGRTTSSQMDFFVREDSYIDPASGLAYIYIKQTINGLVVEDGNLNVVLASDGSVLSYGSSLYNGDVPLAFTNPVQAQETYTDAECEHLRSRIDHLLFPDESLQKRDQLVFAASQGEAKAAPEGDLKALQRDLYLMCDDPSDSPYLQGRDFGSLLPGSLEREGSKVKGSGHSRIVDARLATLEFVKIASTDDQLVLSLSAPDSGFESVAATISSSFEQSLRPDGRPEQVEKLYNVPGTTDAVSARLGYLQNEEGKLNLVWRLEVPMDHQENSNFYQATVDATTGEVRSSADWVASAPMHHHDVSASTLDGEDSPEAWYKVIRWGLNDPSEGNRSLERGVHDKAASPYGWHSVPGKKDYKDTRGNNVLASAFGASMDDWQVPQRARPEGKLANGSLVFDFPFPWRAADKAHEVLSPNKYADASTVNLFYSLNEYHDLLYLYGFTPAAGNFEEAEAKEGGIGGDPIVAYAISSAGINNADFTTPPDGSKPRVRMYKWKTKENATERDGDFEEGVIIHEMTHGVSTRLTGGPADSSCLGWGESGGMGEGWGDFFATVIRRKSPTRDIYPLGSWVSHAKAGIRRYPYSTNLTLNPETYKTLDSPGYWGVHAIGEVWAGMLYQVEEGLRAKHGWHPDLFPPTAEAPQEEKDNFWRTPEETPLDRASKRPIPRHGNTLAVQLVLDGMKLQPCRPSFFDARDAIIQADKHLTGGANECLIWSRFAQRGLGVDAKVVGRTPWGGGIRTDGHAVPSRCKDSHE